MLVQLLELPLGANGSESQYSGVRQLHVLRDDTACLWHGATAAAAAADDAEEEVKVERDGGVAPHHHHRRLASPPAAAAACDCVCGNKARKLYALYRMPRHKLPRTVVSHGGAQSNAMRALAALAHRRRLRFRYITPDAPQWLRASPTGNYRRALELGAEFVHVARRGPAGYASVVARHAAAVNVDDNNDGKEARRRDRSTLFVPQGGASSLARDGIRMLAEEITESIAACATTSSSIDAVCLPSGTGTTAFFLRQYLPPRVRVLTVPCVGDERYLAAQMRRLHHATVAVAAPAAAAPAEEEEEEEEMTTPARLPTIVPPAAPRTPFAALVPQDLHWWRALRARNRHLEYSGIGVGCDDGGKEDGDGAGDFFLDLVYAPRTLRALVQWCAGGAAAAPPLERVLYIATGGAEGNATQWRRYRRAGLV